MYVFIVSVVILVIISATEDIHRVRYSVFLCAHRQHSLHCLDFNYILFYCDTGHNNRCA